MSEGRRLDEAVSLVKGKAREFARLPPGLKAALLRECIPRLVDVAPRWVADGCEAKGLGPGESGEEWLVGPLPTVRMMRLLAESLDEIAVRGRPPLGRVVRQREDGRLEIEVLPAGFADRLLYRRFTGFVLTEPGIDEDTARANQAAFYQERDPAGGLSVILGAGNVSSIPPMDVL
ncbi:MAG: hypothetical protein L0227_07745, partial [Chloroflexi bacterium]|nr:hypothetical protein [Chloroflexota bacterium]